MWLANLSEEQIRFCCLEMQGEKHAVVLVKEKWEKLQELKILLIGKCLLLTTLLLSL